MTLLSILVPAVPGTDTKLKVENTGQEKKSTKISLNIQLDHIIFWYKYKFPMFNKSDSTKFFENFLNLQ